MKYRLNKFFARKAYTGDTTEVIDINIRDVISSIIIGLEVTDVTHPVSAHVVAAITKIELVDGSDVLYSLDGHEAEALDWHDNLGKFRYNRNLLLTGNVSSRYIGINFGRYLWDKEYAFDPKRFNNPQLRITIDFDAPSANVTSVHLTAWANIFDEEAPSLKGFLMSKEIKKYTIGAATHEYTDMPTDHPYRGLYIRPYVYGTNVSEVISNIKLSEDQDKMIPFDQPVEDIIRCVQNNLPFVDEFYITPTYTTAKDLFVAPGERVTAVAAAWRTSIIDAKPAYFYGGSGRLAAIYGTTGPNVQVHVRGRLPHSVIQIPFGLQDDPADWYDVRRLGNLRLDITGTVAAVGHIFVQQLRSY